MAHYAGLDVSLNTTALCVLDAEGNIVREAKVTSEPQAVENALWADCANIALIGLEAGPLSQWLFDGLVEAGFPAVCCETRHTKAFLKARRTKTDRSDARGIAQMIRTSLYQEVHVKTRARQRVRGLLSARKTLQAQALDIENSIRGLLRNFGLNVGQVSTGRFAARVKETAPEQVHVTPDMRAEVDRTITRLERQLAARTGRTD